MNPDILEHQRPEGDCGSSISRRVGSYRTSVAQDLAVQGDIRRKGDFHDVIHAIGRKCPQLPKDLVGGVAAVADDLVCPADDCDSSVSIGTDVGNYSSARQTRQAYGAKANRSRRALDEHAASIDRSGNMYGSMGGDPWDSEASPLLEGDVFRQQHG